MAVSIKEEGFALLLDPSPDYLTTANHMEVSDNLELADNFDIVDRDIEGEAFEDDPEEEDCRALRTRGPPADIELAKLPRPASSLNCRQARSYLVKLLRAANGGQNPQYGNESPRSVMRLG